MRQLLCKLFGHRFDPLRYFRPGQRSVLDGLGRLHINIEGQCARCESMVEFGQLHVPNGPWEFDHRLRRYVQRVEIPERCMASWDAEHPHPVTIKEVVDNEARRNDLPPLNALDMPAYDSYPPHRVRDK